MSKILIVSLTILFGAGCQTPPIDVSVTSTPPAVTAPAWTVVDQGVEKYIDGSLTLYRFASSTRRWHWAYDQTAPKRMSEWRTQYPDAKLIVNGVYFLEDFSPAGYLTIDGKRVGQKRFDDDKSGMIDLTNGLRIVNTKREPLDPKLLKEVGQSYPFLITDGKIAIEKDSGLIARRTYVGTDTADRIYIGILTEQKSLFALSERLRELDILWKEVLNLDGGPSTGLSAHFPQDQNTVESFIPIPIVLLALPSR